jgi:hypothetical protein
VRVSADRLDVVGLKRAGRSGRGAVVNGLTTQPTRQVRSATTLTMLTFQHAVAVTVAEVAHRDRVPRGRGGRGDAAPA